MSELSTDYWLSEASDLRAPKSEVADYVEQQGFLVPQRFETLEEALDTVRQGGEIIVRSEHVEEYDGPSGLLSSYRISPEMLEIGQKTIDRWPAFDVDEQVILSADRMSITVPEFSDGPGSTEMEDVVIGLSLDAPAELTVKRLRTLVSQHYPLVRYAQLTGRDVSEVMEGTDFSYWQYISGKNVTVVADSAIDNKYHVFANGSKGKGMPYYHGWQIVNESGVSNSSKINDDVLTPQAVKDIIQTYEGIRNLPKFAAEHCPSIELQLDDDNQLWFLQYHRTRDFKAAGPSLSPSDFATEDGWHKADAVRGALDEPATLEMALWYPENYGSKLHNAIQLPKFEQASVDWHYDVALSEVLSRRRTAYVADRRGSDIFSGLAVAHETRSKWFKPIAAIACNDRGLKELIPESTKSEVSRMVHREEALAQIVIDIALDGHTGYIRLNPEAEQPLVN